MCSKFISSPCLLLYFSLIYGINAEKIYTASELIENCIYLVPGHCMFHENPALELSWLILNYESCALRCITEACKYRQPVDGVILPPGFSMDSFNETCYGLLQFIVIGSTQQFHTDICSDLTQQDVCRHYVRLLSDDRPRTLVLYERNKCLNENDESVMQVCSNLEHVCVRPPARMRSCEFLVDEAISECTRNVKSSGCQGVLYRFSTYCEEDDCFALERFLTGTREFAYNNEKLIVGNMASFLLHCDASISTDNSSRTICSRTLHIYSNYTKAFHDSFCPELSRSTNSTLTLKSACQKTSRPSEEQKPQSASLLILIILFVLATLVVLITIFFIRYILCGHTLSIMHGKNSRLLADSDHLSALRERGFKPIKRNDSIKMEIFVINSLEMVDGGHPLYFDGRGEDRSLGFFVDLNSEVVSPNFTKSNYTNDVFESNAANSQTEEKTDTAAKLSIPGLRDKKLFSVSIMHNPDGAYVFIEHTLFATTSRLGTDPLKFILEQPKSASIMRHYEFQLQDDENPEGILDNGSTMCIGVLKRPESGDRKLVVKLIGNEFGARGTTLAQVCINNSGEYYVCSEERNYKPLKTEAIYDWDALMLLIFVRLGTYIQVYAGTAANQYLVGSLLLPVYFRYMPKIEARLEVDETNCDIYIPKMAAEKRIHLNAYVFKRQQKNVPENRKTSNRNDEEQAETTAQAQAETQA